MSTRNQLKNFSSFLFTVMSFNPNDPNHLAALAAYELVREPIGQLLWQQEQLMQQQKYMLEQQQHQHRHNEVLVQEVMDLRQEIKELRSQLEETDAVAAAMASSGEQPRQQQQREEALIAALPPQQQQQQQQQREELLVAALLFVLSKGKKYIPAPLEGDDKASVSAKHIIAFLEDVCQLSPDNAAETYETMRKRIWDLGMDKLYLASPPPKTAHNNTDIDTRKNVMDLFRADMWKKCGVDLTKEKFESDWVVKNVFAIRWNYEKTNEHRRKYVGLVYYNVLPNTNFFSSKNAKRTADEMEDTSMASASSSRSPLLVRQGSSMVLE